MLNAAKAATEEIITIYATNFSTTTKSDGTPVTKADLAASLAIEDVLRVTDLPVVSEENDNTAFNIRKNWKEYWLVDPLDGTKEFVAKNGEFCVNIALIRNGKPALGCIYSPTTGEYVWGGENADFRSNVPIETTIDKNVMIVTGSKREKQLPDNHESFLLNRNMKRLYKGSALKFLDLALGRADIYFRQGPTQEWDTAAGQAILESVGGQLMNFQKESLSYNKSSLLNPNFVGLGRYYSNKIKH